MKREFFRKTPDGTFESLGEFESVREACLFAGVFAQDVIDRDQANQMIRNLQQALGVFASVGWTPDDVMVLVPRMTQTDAIDWLDWNTRHIRDFVVERGFNAIEQMLIMDGVDMSPVDVDEPCEEKV